MGRDVYGGVELFNKQTLRFSAKHTRLLRPSFVLKIMNQIESVYINGQFAVAHGHESANVKSPLNGKIIGKITYADEEDAQLAIKAASIALETCGQSMIA